MTRERRGRRALRRGARVGTCGGKGHRVRVRSWRWSVACRGSPLCLRALCETCRTWMPTYGVSVLNRYSDALNAPRRDWDATASARCAHASQNSESPLRQKENTHQCTIHSESSRHCRTRTWGDGGTSPGPCLRLLSAGPSCAHPQDRN